MARQPEAAHVEIEATYQKDLDAWQGFTLNQALAELRKQGYGNRNGQAARALQPFVVECFRMYPGLTFGKLRHLMATKFSHVYQLY